VTVGSPQLGRPNIGNSAAVAEMGSYLRAVEAYLSENPGLVEELQRLRGFGGELDVGGYLRREIRELTSSPVPELIIAVDDRMLDLLEEAASAAAENLFTNNESEIAAVNERQPAD
jgi:hypothetical protein